jgi:SAM-dependent methyltransferase
VSDNWSSGDAYEAYVGRWSRLVGREFLAWLDAPAGGRWLDVGCGTGELCRAIAERGSESVTGVDPSEAFLEYARRRGDGIEYRTGDAQSLPFADGEFDAVVSGLALNFVPDPAAGASEMMRVTRRSGAIGAYVWDYAEGMQFMRYFWDAAKELDLAAVELDEGRRFPICNRDPPSGLFAAAGDVETRAIDLPTYFTSFEDFWNPFLSGTGTAPSYVASLSEDARIRLRERLRERLRAEEDGSIKLMARAWAAKGTKV